MAEYRHKTRFTKGLKLPQGSIKTSAIKLNCPDTLLGARNKPQGDKKPRSNTHTHAHTLTHTHTRTHTLHILTLSQGSEEALQRLFAEGWGGGYRPIAVGTDHSWSRVGVSKGMSNAGDAICVCVSGRDLEGRDVVEGT